MHTLLAFAITLVLITALSLRYRAPPFLLLTGGAVLYGLMAGTGPSAILPAAAGGAGRVFASLGIIIFSGSCIAALLRGSRHLDRIYADLKAAVPSRAGAAGVAGYLFSLPLMCCITSFMILSPLVAKVEEGGGVAGKRLLYILATGSVLSYVLVYPSPVIITLAGSQIAQGISPWGIMLVTLPLSLLLLAAATLLLACWHPEPDGAGEGAGGQVTDLPRVSFLRAWAPVLTPVVLVAAGLMVPGLGILADVDGAMIAALLVGIFTVPGPERLPGLERGTRNAGIIIFDICGAGALGAVIAATPFADQTFRLAGALLPAVLIPFALAALLQAGLGSRVVTAIVATTILAGSTAVAALSPLVTVLLIASGILLCSYLTDPYFWLIHRVTGDGVPEVAKYYSVPLLLAGCAVLLAGLAVHALTGAG